MAVPGSLRTVRQLVDEHYQNLYRYAYRLSGSAADAEDLVQESFCKAMAKIGQLRDAERAKPWLFSILRHAFLRRERADRQHREVPLDFVGDLPEAGADDSPFDVEPERLQGALNELPELYRSPIILYYFEDFSYRDIAEQMDLPIGTVMSRLARAKAFLRGRLEPAPRAEAARRATDGP
jgi:RNA polymerase sigma-70 factor (ECF subfamily)